ncbi:photosynthetic NDH subunit of subcomplex B 5, chloroplastic-like isoform X2 [Asparagus officinalis]|nr:photosynthetic NDH subunit of subcomplex B 5, chloroplastic-like isoform X2 [Asparagus officinalis]
MAVSTSPLHAFPPSISVRCKQPAVRVPSRETRELHGFLRFDLGRKPNGKSTRLNAGLTEVEPDLEEDYRDRWRTNGISPEDFIYGEFDGHHTYHEGSEVKGPFWETVAKEYQAAEPPTGFQGLISWLFLPAVAAG